MLRVSELPANSQQGTAKAQRPCRAASTNCKEEDSHVVEWEEGVWAKIERALESFLVWSRWLLSLFFLGLIGTIGLLLVKYSVLLFKLYHQALGEETKDFIPKVLELLDITLTAALLLMVIFSGYKNFVSNFELPKQEQLSWLQKVDFSELKIKLMGIMVVITGIELLKAITSADSTDLVWKIVIHLVFVVSGVLFALTEQIAAGKSH